MAVKLNVSSRHVHNTIIKKLNNINDVNNVFWPNLVAILALKSFLTNSASKTSLWQRSPSNRLTFTKFEQLSGFQRNSSPKSIVKAGKQKTLKKFDQSNKMLSQNYGS